MTFPCDKCLVKICCTKPCRDYAISLYYNKKYREKKSIIDINLDNMSFENAINHILKVEAISFYIREICTENEFKSFAPVAQ